MFQTAGPVVIYSASGTGAWEAAFVNTLSPGDTVLMVETGQFATLWRDMAVKLGLQVDFIPGDWRHGVDAAAIGEKLTADRSRTIKAVAVVHNETSTGVTSNIPAVRRAMDEAGTSGAPARRRDLVARLHRLSSRRMARRRDHQQLAERDDAAAGDGLQRDQRRRARRVGVCRACRAPTGTGSR